MRGHHARSSGALKACFGEGASAAAALVPAASARHETGDGLCMSCLLDWVCFFLSQGQCTAHDRCSTNRISVTSDTLRLCLTSRPNPPARAAPQPAQPSALQAPEHLSAPRASASPQQYPAHPAASSFVATKGCQLFDLKTYRLKKLQELIAHRFTYLQSSMN